MSVKQKKVIFNIILLLLVLSSGILMYSLKENKTTQIKSNITVESTSYVDSTPEV